MQHSYTELDASKATWACLLALQPHWLGDKNSPMDLQFHEATWACHPDPDQQQLLHVFSLLHFHWSLEVFQLYMCTLVPGPVPIQFPSGSDPVPIRFRSGSDPVPIRFMSGCLTLRGMMITTYRHHWSHHPQVAFSRNQIPPQIEHHRLHRYI